MLRIKKGDKVFVTTGKDKGKTGKVVRVLPATLKAIVENVNVVKKAVRKGDQYPQGGFVEMERPVYISNLALVDQKTNKPVRFNAKVLQDGSKVRINKKTGDVI